MSNWIKALRSFVRPYLALLFGTTIVVLGSYLVVKFGNEDIMLRFADFMIVTGGIIIGFYFAARMIKK